MGPRMGAAMSLVNGRPPDSLEQTKTSKRKPGRRAKLELVNGQGNQGEPPKDKSTSEGLPAGFLFRSGGGLPGLCHVEPKEDGEAVGPIWLPMYF